MPASPSSATPHLDKAFATLARACRMMADVERQGRGTPPPSGSMQEARHARFIGNNLRELDRFLNILLDEAMRLVAPAGYDHPAFARRHNAPAKMRSVLAMIGLERPADERLRAIGRRRMYLHGCRDVAVYDGRHAMPKGAMRGTSVAPSVPEDTGGYYLQTANKLMFRLQSSGHLIDFSRSPT